MPTWFIFAGPVSNFAYHSFKMTSHTFPYGIDSWRLDMQVTEIDYKKFFIANLTC